MRKATMIVLSLTVSVASASIWIALANAKHAAPPRPFMADFTQTAFTNGSAIDTIREVIAVRADGSLARSREFRDSTGASVEIRVIYDVGRQTRVLVHSGAKSISTIPISPDQVARLVRGENCDLVGRTEKSTILGHEVRKITTALNRNPKSHELGGRFLSVERWLAPGIRCLALRTNAFRDGVLVMSNVVRNLELGEPDSSLFTWPSDYREMSPLEVMQYRNETVGDVFRIGGELETAVQTAYEHSSGRAEMTLQN